MRSLPLSELVILVLFMLAEDYIILTTIPIFTDPKLWFAECQTNMKSVQSLSKCPNCDGSD
ncbi:hypothetical protein CsatB_019673 [Cannabis sativa]|uniref:Uncharacterized protein n=1 Tax=Cannabis sativa TaxID=3483 RepID=A0A803R9W4_CANSA